MSNEKKYQVFVGANSWDSHQQAFCNNYSEPVTGIVDLEAAKAAWKEQWDKREETASYHRAPITIDLCEVEVYVDEDDVVQSDGVVDTYSAEPAPNGDPSWNSYYDGEDRTGWYVLWAHNMVGGYRGSKYGTNCLDIIGRHQAQHCGTGEYALRHADDKAGALYADELVETIEEMVALVGENDSINEDQAVLAELVRLGATATAIPYVRESKYLNVMLPSGFNWEREDPHHELTDERFYIFDTDGKLYAIEVSEPETEEA